MGMKRRGTGRRQVLNLNDKQDSPRRTWQTKYQQICQEHVSQNGESSDSTAIVHASSSKDVNSNPLSGLVGQYHSDSEAEEEGREAAGKLDAKVSDFLKEIQSIAPAKPQIEPTPQMAALLQSADSGLHMQQQQQQLQLQQQQQQQQLQHQQPSTGLAWQECYDENSGYVYYWNVETNEVTWEMPPEYQAYIASTTQAQQQWMMEQSMAMMPMMASHPMMAHPSMMPQIAQASMSSPRLTTSTASKSRGDLRPPGTTSENSVVSGTKPRRSKTATSDSEEERIEMITSYGPASDEESEDEEIVSRAKRKSKTKQQNSSKSNSYASGVFGVQMMGPELPSESTSVVGPQPLMFDVNTVSEEQNDAERVASSGSQILYNNDEGSLLNSDGVSCGTSTLLSNNVPDMGPPGEETKNQEAETDSSKNDQYETRYSAPDSSEDKKAPEEGASKVEVNSLPECESSVATESLGNDNSANPSPMPATTSEESDESAETDEGAILSRLRSRAKELKELGGEIPDEIRHLIDHSVSDSASPAIAEDVIAQIERELPPDYVKSETKRKESDNNEKKAPQSTTSGSEQSPKTTSFALIAGYGDESDQEEDSSNNSQSKKKAPKPTSDNLGNSSTPLFPILDHESQASCSKVTEGDSTALVTPSPASNSEIQENNINGTNESIPSSSKISEVSDFSGVGGESSTSATASSIQLQESNECVSMSETSTGLESNLPDSTTNSKAYKRKIRLEIGASYPAKSVPKSTASTEQHSSATVVTCADSKTHRPSTSTTSTAAASSTVNYSTWTHYNSDPSSGDRRGFGFQNSDGGFQSVSSDNCSTAKSQPKKGIINFVKAETINLPKTEEPKKVDATEENQSHGEAKADRKEDMESWQQIAQLAELITEKVKFLEEGKDPVSPVQIMAIQIETLVSAWQAGALAQPYLSNWLGDTGAELARLEQAAAPEGWACEWDRALGGSDSSGMADFTDIFLPVWTHKRYYYRNTVTGETQWEYPTQPEEDVYGGAEAMELCTTPPPPPTPPPAPPEEEAAAAAEEEEEQQPKTPPPPQISEQNRPVTPPPPRISQYFEKSQGKTEEKSDSSSTQRKRKRKMDEVTSTSSEVVKETTGNGSSTADTAATSSSSSPTSTPMLPPLPPLPPPPTAPPPPPPPPPPSDELPPLPPTSPTPLPPRLENEHGEPLPPGVDPPELPYIVARPHAPPSSTSSSSPYHIQGIAPRPSPHGATAYPPLPQSSPPTRPPDSTELENVLTIMAEEQMLHQMHSQYLMNNAYQASVVSSSSAMAMSGPPLEYGAVPYVTAMTMPMTTAHIISRPAAKKAKVSLHAELDSFYSDLASLESSGAIPSAMQEQTLDQNSGGSYEHGGFSVHDVTEQPGPSGYNQPPTTSVEAEPAAPASKTNETAPAEPPKKKKKPKLAPGLSLKKKGVSSMVAKWQQVQQEVRREYKNDDDDDDSSNVSSTHK